MTIPFLISNMGLVVQLMFPALRQECQSNVMNTKPAMIIDTIPGHRHFVS